MYLQHQHVNQESGQSCQALQNNSAILPSRDKLNTQILRGKILLKFTPGSFEGIKPWSATMQHLGHCTSVYHALE